MRQKVAEFWNLVFGFRKFIIMLVVYVIAILFRVLDLINGSEMTELLKDTTLGFLGANGIEHIVGAVKGYAASRNAHDGDDPNTPWEDLVARSAMEAEDMAQEAVSQKGAKNEQ